jgi:hypothetical protein
LRRRQASPILAGMRRQARVLALALLLAPLAGCLGTGGGPPYIREPILAPGFGSPGSGRYVRGPRDVVCDRRTEICYKDGHIDKTETRAAFGKGAARDADRLRDRLGTGDVFVPRRGRGSYCLNDEKVCYKNGRPDRSDTRDVYGKKAARRLR